MSDNLLVIDSPNEHAADVALARDCAGVLDRHYPSQLWAVHVHGGVVDIHNLRLSGKWGFRFNVTEAFSWTDLEKKLMRAGGEVLERYRLSREKMSVERASDKALALPTDFAGHVVFDQ